jgi:hypothetical protein
MHEQKEHKTGIDKHMHQPAQKILPKNPHLQYHIKDENP